MKILKMETDQLKFAPYNARTMKTEEFEKLKNSIKSHNCYEPPIVNSRTGHVVGGNQRLRALTELGYKEIDVVVVDLSLNQEKQLNLALNKIMGDWDDVKLGALIDELTRLPDLDLSLTGFEPQEISSILDEYFEPKGDSFDFDGAVDAIEEPITKPGDILTLGSHRVLCGDATILENVQRLFEHNKASLYWCDLPYGVNYNASNRPGVSKSQWTPIQNDDLSDEKYPAWMRRVVGVTVDFLLDGSPVYVWNGHRQFWTMHQALKEFGIYPASVLTWAKPSFSPSFCDYQFATEFLIYGWKEGAGHPFYGSSESTLWEVKRDPSKNLIHPTQKPIELAQRAIRNSSQRGEIVFDSCLGSGSALIAAESLGRRCFGVEIEPKYCDAIVRRYIAFAGVDKVSHETASRYLKEVDSECR